MPAARKMADGTAKYHKMSRVVDDGYIDLQVLKKKQFVP